MQLRRTRNQHDRIIFNGTDLSKLVYCKVRRPIMATVNATFESVPGRHVFFRVADSPRPQVLLVFRAEATERPPAPDARLPVPPHGARGPGHVCLAVAPEALDRWHDHLLAHGIAIEADFRWPNGARSLYFRDPAGNSLECAEPAIWNMEEN